MMVSVKEEHLPVKPCWLFLPLSFSVKYYHCVTSCCVCLTPLVIYLWDAGSEQQSEVYSKALDQHKCSHQKQTCPRSSNRKGDNWVWVEDEGGEKVNKKKSCMRKTSVTGKKLSPGTDLFVSELCFYLRFYKSHCRGRWTQTGNGGRTLSQWWGLLWQWCS